MSNLKDLSKFELAKRLLLLLRPEFADESKYHINCFCEVALVVHVDDADFPLARMELSWAQMGELAEEHRISINHSGAKVPFTISPCGKYAEHHVNPKCAIAMCLIRMLESPKTSNTIHWWM